MPTYGYKCEKCGLEFDLVRSMTAPPLEICPRELCRQKKWGRGRVKKQIGGGAGLIFKGSGFYITDYRSNNYKESAKKDHAPASPAAAPATPAAPASTPAAKPQPAPKADKK
jgi:putative FmdB family regulatory protein